MKRTSERSSESRKHSTSLSWSEEGRYAGRDEEFCGTRLSLIWPNGRDADYLRSARLKAP